MEGIILHSWNEDNYGDKGAGHYQLNYLGLEFELMGKHGNLSLQYEESPTKILFGNTWCRAHNHPGQYIRGRYGKNYLKHVQSWRHVSTMKESHDSYSAHINEWTHCEDPEMSTCLELMRQDGNIEYLPHRYP